MAKIRRTTKEIMAKLNVDQGMANGLLRCLVATKQAAIVDTQKVEGAKGKGASVYEMDESIALTL